MPPRENKAAKGQITSSPNAQAITTKIVMEFKDRQRAEIQRWQRAIATATQPDAPRMYELQDMFDNLKADGHYIGDMRVRRAATLCTPFSIIDKNTGKVQDEKTEFFARKWFYDFMKNALDYAVRGYTQLELVDTQMPKFKLIPRRNLVPPKHEILLSVQDSKGIDYTPEMGRTIVEIGEEDDLGLMADICGQLIWKRNAQQSWAEFSERFGFPLITATTNKSNAADIANIRKMLAALGEAANAVLPEGTTIDIKPSATGDAYLVYDKQIERINAEISKALLSGTMVTDNGSSRSQSEVHERTLDDKVAEDDRRVITFTVNDQIIPMLALWGHDLNPEVDRFRFEPSNQLTLDKLWTMLDGMLNRFDIPMDWISRKFGVPIDALKAQIPATPIQQQAQPKKPQQPQASIGGFTANFR